MATSNILTGQLWTDHLSGTKLLTLTGTASATLQAALPIYVTFVGSHLWNVVRLAVWHSFWSPKTTYQKPYRDLFGACNEQRLVIIRNSSDAFSLGWSLVKHWWHWRRFFKEKKERCFVSPPVATIVLCFAWWGGWIYTGVVVAQIWDPKSTPQDQALLRGNCGNVAFLNVSSSDQQSTLRALNNNYTVMADEYVRQCYADEISPTASCSYFTQIRVEIKESSGDCPFIGDGICIAGAEPYVLETPFIDSSHVLGINAALEDRVAFRKRTTCAPISSKGRTDIVNYNETTDRQIWPDDTRLYRFYFGRVGDAGSNDSYVSDWTYEFSSWEPEHNLQYDTA